MHLRPYLEVSWFTSRADQNYIRWLLNISVELSLLDRRRFPFAELDYKVTNRSGLKHPAADVLSCTITDGTDQTY